MRNEKLTAVLEGLGCSDVRPVVASGNVVFRSAARSGRSLETKIERAFAKKLELSLDVITRRQDELESLLRRDPFRGAVHGREWYLTVTFFKDGKPPVCTKLKRAGMDGPKFMADLEKRHGKRITTRTWNTVQKIVAKMQGVHAD